MQPGKEHCYVCAVRPWSHGHEGGERSVPAGSACHGLVCTESIAGSHLLYEVGIRGVCDRVMAVPLRVRLSTSVGGYVTFKAGKARMNLTDFYR